MLYASVTRYGLLPHQTFWGQPQGHSPGWLADPARRQLAWLADARDRIWYLLPSMGSEMDSWVAIPLPRTLNQCCLQKQKSPSWEVMWVWGGGKHCLTVTCCACKRTVIGFHPRPHVSQLILTLGSFYVHKKHWHHPFHIWVTRRAPLISGSCWLCTTPQRTAYRTIFLMLAQVTWGEDAGNSAKADGKVGHLEG